jgi:hypothetical protein
MISCLVQEINNVDCPLLFRVITVGDDKASPFTARRQQRFAYAGLRS